MGRQPSRTVRMVAEKYDGGPGDIIGMLTVPAAGPLTNMMVDLVMSLAC